MNLGTNNGVRILPQFQSKDSFGKIKEAIYVFDIHLHTLLVSEIQQE